ncbi:MAG: thioredoxin domain-containing protein [Oscillospiraceae bacterium]|nr:thioredoxin domain-containing protein [Oscillospiraceae bacterium]
MANNLKNETSPYLLQHKDNPVNWYSWGMNAFEKAKKENKPIFLSIGYSTCHWCHVMAHECFEDKETADLLNEYFISVKVDREERPDIDNIYMSACQALTGSGGWPLSVFITPEQKPFFAGSYFPKPMFRHLLKQIHELWQTKHDEVIASGNEIEKAIRIEHNETEAPSQELLDTAFNQFERAFDKVYGGFGAAPKFPTPHNLIFLLNYYRRTKEQSALEMAELTLTQMYKGGIFDHIGYGFSRYSTDRYYLVPHFEKMLYDNALLITSYITAYAVTNKPLYKEIAEKTARYIMREMTDKSGGFYSAQDADSEGEEGKYYVFGYDEIPSLIGRKAGEEFNDYYGITENGNFAGKNIPNLLHNPEKNDKFEKYLPTVYEYRKSKTQLHLDDKILTAWNSLMISAFALMYRVLRDGKYLDAAEKACRFIEAELSENDNLFVSFREEKHSGYGFLDDYAFCIFALIQLYEACFNERYLDRAIQLCKKTINDFYDDEHGGFYLYGAENEQLIIKPKEVYDGALPSGNSVMSYNLVLLSQLTEDHFFDKITGKQLTFMSGKAKNYPMGYCFYLSALSMYINPPTHIVCALAGEHQSFPIDSVVRMINGGNDAYPIVNNRTTYYVCRNRQCLPPVNNLDEAL